MREFGSGASGPWHPAGGTQSDEEADQPALAELVLQFQSWSTGDDGTDPHEILANDIVMGASHVRDRDGALAWSPAGDRIALGLEGAIYTFATDGSDFTHVTSGDSPLWSPDGSQLVNRSSATWHPGTPADGVGR